MFNYKIITRGLEEVRINVLLRITSVIGIRAVQVQVYTEYSENSQRKNMDLIKAKQIFSNTINKDYVRNAPFLLMWRKKKKPAA